MGYCDERPMDSIRCNQDSFSKPMPSIGIYIAAFSLFCSLAMAADIVRGFRRRKFWFPSKFFALNATSLMGLGVAIKLALDLNNPMPGSFDQFSKLSSIIFMSTSMANFIPSLGDMNNTEVLMNMIALGILLITLLVNVSIQLGTGLIFLFRVELVLAVCLAFLLFWTMSCSALVVPTTKRILERKYLEISEMIEYEKLEGGGEKLKEQVIKCWLMAESSNPQFVMVRSPTCFASSGISCLGAVVLCQAFIRLYLPSRFSRIYSEDGGRYSSDYQGLTYVIVWIQCLGVVIGTVAPLFRCFIVLKIKSSRGGRECSRSFSPEKYWTEGLKEWKKSHLPFQIGGRYFMKAIKKSKDMVLCFCIKLQVMTVVVCKSVLFCLAPVRLLLSFFLKPKLGDNSEVHDVSCYILHLDGEDILPEVMAESKNVLYCKFFQKGINQQPKQLLKLLEKMTTNFDGVARFDSNNDISELPNCWKLPVITLTTIAIALLGSGVKEVENLRCSVSQGLKYMSIVDEILDTGGVFKRVRDAAEEVWSDLDLSGEFLNKGLRQRPESESEGNDVLSRLCDIARVYIDKACNDERLDKDCSRWPNKVIAAYSMREISNSIMNAKVEDEKLFEHISVMIADILGACLTNLPEAVTRKCSSVSIEKREETVQEMAHIIGETEEILNLLQNHQLPINLATKRRIDIDEWRRSLIGTSLSVSSSLSRSNRSASASASSVVLPTFTDTQS